MTYNDSVNLTLGYADRQYLEVTSRIDLFMRVVEARINRVLGDASVIIDNEDLNHLRINSDSLIPRTYRKAEHKIWWDYSTIVERNNQLVNEVLKLLGKTDEEIDQMFINASQL